MRGDDETRDRARGARQALAAALADAGAAVHFVAPWSPAPPGASAAAGSAFVPAAGLALGVVVLLADAGAAPLGPWPRSGVAVIAGALLTAAASERGAATTAAAAFAGGRDAALRRLRPGSGSRWAGAAVLLAIRLGLVAALDGLRAPALVFAPLLGSWSAVVTAFGARHARHAGSGRKFARDITFRDFALGSVFTCAVLFAAAEALGILAVLCAALITVGLRLGWHRWLGGVEEPLVRCTAAAVELAVLALFAALQAGS